MIIWMAGGSVEQRPEKRYLLEDLRDVLPHVPFAVLSTVVVPDFGTCRILGYKSPSNGPLNKQASIVVGRPVYGNAVVLKKGIEIT